MYGQIYGRIDSNAFYLYILVFLNKVNDYENAIFRIKYRVFFRATMRCDALNYLATKKSLSRIKKS